MISKPDLWSFTRALAASEAMLGLGAGLLVSLTSLSLTSLMLTICIGLVISPTPEPAITFAFSLSRDWVRGWNNTRA